MVHRALHASSFPVRRRRHGDVHDQHVDRPRKPPFRGARAPTGGIRRAAPSDAAPAESGRGSTICASRIDRHWRTDEVRGGRLQAAAPPTSAAAPVCSPSRSPGSGARVTGLDASPELIVAARDHAAAQGLGIDYRVGGAGRPHGQYDLVTCWKWSSMSPNRPVRPRSRSPPCARRAAHPVDAQRHRLVEAADDYVGRGSRPRPRGTHDFAKFIAPERLKSLLGDAGLNCADVEGIAFSPTRGLHLSEDLRLLSHRGDARLSDLPFGSRKSRPALNRH